MNHISLYKILHRDISSPLKMVGPKDYSLSEEQIISESDLEKLGPLSPYAVNVDKKTNLYIAKLNFEEALEATFYYRYQRENANYLVEIPWIIGQRLPPKRKFMTPTFVFSPGRCGSTLLTKFFKATNTPSFSEPDFYTQICLTKINKEDQPAKDLLKRVNTIMTHDLLSAHGLNLKPHVAIKLRAECTRDPRYFIFQNNKQQRTIFLTRHFLPWAKSAFWHFKKINPKLVDNLPIFYEQTIRCYRYLNEATNCQLLTYENMTENTPDNLLQLSKVIGKPIDQNLFENITATDSQLGSGIESEQYTLQDNEKALIQDAYEKWLKLTQHHYLANTPLAYLLDTKAHTL
jgi:hypothetical protein